MVPAGPSNRKKKLLFLTVLGAIFIQLLPIWLLKEQIESGSSDFSAFYTAGKIVATGHGSQLYNLGVQREEQRIFSSKFGRPPLLPFNHPPFEALIFAPLSLFGSYNVAFALWLACNVALSIGSIFLLRPYLNFLENFFDLVLIANSFFLPLLVAISQGQDSVLLLFLFTLCFANLMRDRHRLAGCCLALAIFKPQLVLPVLLVLALAHEQRRRLLSGFLLTCLALGVLSLALVGWHALLAYPAVLLHYVPENPGIIAPASMPNLRGLFYVLLSQRIPLRLLNWSVAAISAGLLAGTAVAWRVGGGRRDLFPLKMALVVTATVLVSFHGNVHDSAVLVLPILLVCNWLMRMGVNTWNRVLLAVLIAGLLLLPMISANRQVLGCVTLALLVATGCELLQNRAGGAAPAFSALAASRGASCGTLSE